MLVPEYRQIIQPDSMSDSEMIVHIKHMKEAGFDMVEITYDEAGVHWVFMRMVEAEPVALNVFGLKAEA